ncbi:hypothetical protein chiPu_0030670, partial [Chiloscyllium punctatum]|nr:hypothetical protein [Chiloscyllium punctatum]
MFWNLTLTPSPEGGGAVAEFGLFTPDLPPPRHTPQTDSPTLPRGWERKRPDEPVRREEAGTWRKISSYPPSWKSRAGFQAALKMASLSLPPKGTALA